MNNDSIFVDDILKEYTSPTYLGGGGQKVVYRAIHPLYGKVVVKIGKYQNNHALERIRREVQILSKISSPYFPTQYSFNTVKENRFSIVEEYIDGIVLQECMTKYNSECIILEFALQMIEILINLWERNIVHRDIKPENIIITADGPKVIDLGIARVMDSTSLTLSLAPFGPCTPNYAAPEQLQNLKRKIDHRSDQFSLGIVVAQLLLNGQHPFDPNVVNDGSSIPENILNGKWATFKVKDSASPEFFSVIQKMLGIQPYSRFRLYKDLQKSILAIHRRFQ
jgi:serine/threonine protein kinase